MKKIVVAASIMLAGVFILTGCTSDASPLPSPTSNSVPKKTIEPKVTATPAVKDKTQAELEALTLFQEKAAPCVNLSGIMNIQWEVGVYKEEGFEPFDQISNASLTSSEKEQVLAWFETETNGWWDTVNIVEQDNIVKVFSNSEKHCMVSLAMQKMNANDTTYDSALTIGKDS